jgi:hypothetical protein
MPGVPVDITMATDAGVYSIRGYDYLLSVKTSNGVVHYITEPGSSDRRYLGVLVKPQGTVAP